MNHHWDTVAESIDEFDAFWVLSRSNFRHEETPEYFKSVFQANFACEMIVFRQNYNIQLFKFTKREQADPNAVVVCGFENDQYVQARDYAEEMSHE